MYICLCNCFFFREIVAFRVVHLTFNYTAEWLFLLVLPLWSHFTLNVPIKRLVVCGKVEKKQFLLSFSDVKIFFATVLPDKHL